MNLVLKQLNKKVTKTRNLRWFAWAVVAASAGVSIWGNAVHASTAHMDGVGRAISVLPPILYILAFELGSRIPLRRELAWYFKMIRPVATVAVAGIGAYLSYFHQRDAFAAHTGNDLASAQLLPLSIDGLLIISAVCVYELNMALARLIDQIELETVRAEAKAQNQAMPKELVAPVRQTKKERIANLVAQHPELDPEVIASLTNASVGYVNNLMTELRKGNGAELVTAS